MTTPLKIKELFAFVITDEQGDEGIMGFKISDGWLPMVGADMERVDCLRPIADMIAKQSDKTYEIRHFISDGTL